MFLKVRFSAFTFPEGWDSKTRAFSFQKWDTPRPVTALCRVRILFRRLYVSFASREIQERLRQLTAIIGLSRVRLFVLSRVAPRLPPFCRCFLVCGMVITRSGCDTMKREDIVNLTLPQLHAELGKLCR